MKFKKSNPNAITPTRNERSDVGLDLYLCENFYLPGQGTRGVARTGICIEIPYGFEGEVKPRSGFSSKGILACMSTPIFNEKGDLITERFRMNADVKIGTIDPGYTGEIGVIIQNNDQFPMFLPRGTKIAQLVIRPVCMAELEEVEELSDSERGEKGFGSSGAGDGKE